MTQPTKVEVVDYDPQWAENFKALRDALAEHLEGLFLSIEHVGSTSVPGLRAKPVIDMDVVIDKDGATFPAIRQKLEQLGYEHLGDLGVTGREAFKDYSSKAPREGDEKLWPRHNLYVILEDCIALRNHLAFRNYLRAQPEVAHRYGQLKAELAGQHTYDIDGYVDGKTAFITEVLKEAGLSEGEVTEVIRHNDFNT